MSNKLRDVFNKKPIERKIRFEFTDEKGYRDFIEGLKKVNKEGIPVEIQGVKAFHSIAGSGEVNYFDEYDSGIVKSYVCPYQKPIPITLETKFGREEVVLNRIKVDDGYRIKVVIGNTIRFTITSNTNSRETVFNYVIEQKKADSIKELTRNFATALAFCQYLFKNESEIKGIHPDENHPELQNVGTVLDYFYKNLCLISHLEYLNDRFELGITPSEFGDSYTYDDVEELYYSLKGVPIRARENHNSLKVGLKELNPDKKAELLGTAVNLTFPGNVTYNIFGHELTFYSANFLFNAVVAEFKDNGDNTGEVVLKSEKDKTMYISYTAYRTPEEANMAMTEMLTKRDAYYNAPTLAQLISEIREGKRINEVAEVKK